MQCELGPWQPACSPVVQGSAGVGEAAAFPVPELTLSPPPSSFPGNAISCNAGNPSYLTSQWSTLTCNPVTILSQEHLCSQQEPWGIGAHAENWPALIYISPTPGCRFMLTAPC